MIEIKSVNKYYREGRSRHQALKNINLSFRKTEFVAVLGPSGSGKTTLLNVIGGLDHYDSGDLIIDNISTKNYTDRDWDSYRNHSVGFIFQSYNLIQHQTVLSNVEMALTISGVSGAEKRQRAAAALEAVGLGAHLNKRPNQLSGGQMQRVAIARALVNYPSVILADEPTGALDSRTSIQVMDILQRTAKDHLVVMVTHNPELAERYANRIITLKDGEILSDTNPYTPEEKEGKLSSENMGHSSMGVLTALSLSFHNLWAKRKRTFLTAFAGSIGIIGIALIASLSSGVKDYIAKQEANMAYQYPLLVETLNMDISTMLSDFGEQLSEKGTGRVEVIGFLEKLFTVLDTNDVGSVKEYIERPENNISSMGTVEYVYNVQPQIYVEHGGQVKRVCPDSTLDTLGLPVSDIDTSIVSSAVSTNMFYCMPEEKSLYLGRYDVRAGHWPEGPDECVLVLTNEGKITDYLLYVLGLRDPGKVDQFIRDFVHGEKVETEKIDDLSFAYEDFLGLQFKVVDSSGYYSYDAEYGGWRERTGDTAYIQELVEAGRDLTVVGVVQPKSEFGAGVLWPGIDYPFSLVEDTIARARESEIVQAQLADPDTDIFTNALFDQMEGCSNIDPMALMDVDTDMIWDSVKLDRETMNRYFMDGADFDSAQLASPQVPIKSYLDLDAILDAVRAQAEEDLPGLLGGIRLSQEDMTDIISGILEDFMIYMDENGYLDFENLAFHLKTYFSSDAFRSLVRQWAESLDREDMTAEGLNAQADRLSVLIRDSLNSYLAVQGIPAVPFLKNCFEEYLETGRWRAFVRQEIVWKIEKTDIREKLTEYINTTLHPLVASLVGSSLDQLESSVSAQGRDLVAQIQSKLKVCMGNGFSAALSHLPECISVNMDQLTGAFSMRMDTQELSDLLLSFTNLSRASLSKNLSRLGYVEMDHPKSIRIYPRSFEDKDAVIAVLNSYNQQKEISGDQNHSVSYTDTLGTVMGTVTHIITTVTGVLVATVAVSLIVSSIMIGVITYISVLERRKEIGILRAMGASRHNISQIFNAETFITGFLSGSMGVGFGYLLLIPMNYLLCRATGISDIRAFLPPVYAVSLIVISVVLTTIGGIIPSHNASRSDPVEALRTE